MLPGLSSGEIIFNQMSVFQDTEWFEKHAAHGAIKRCHTHIWFLHSTTSYKHFPLLNYELDHLTHFNPSTSNIHYWFSGKS